jgi:serine/threonine protein kinase
LGHLIVQSDLPLEYWSPERIQEKQLTFQSDIYSLGVMLYKMLYGTFPFKATDPSELLKKIKGKKFETL